MANTTVALDSETQRMAEFLGAVSGTHWKQVVSTFAARSITEEYRRVKTALDSAQVSVAVNESVPVPIRRRKVAAE